jgi:Ser/Thr protein kinase RdoA (MazF antagonist)
VSRVLALRQLRLGLLRAGLLVAEPRPLRHRELVRWRHRWVEAERHVAHAQPPAAVESYLWMYGGMGELHGALAGLGQPVPRPVIATYGSSSSMRRWMEVTASAVGDHAASDVARIRRLIGALASQWVPASRLPVQVVHGDIRLGNVALTPDDTTAFLDFGFAATRPRVHDLAYSLSWMVLRPDAGGCAEDFDWDLLPELVDAYQEGSKSRLGPMEWEALGPLLAAVPLYLAAISGFTHDPRGHLRELSPFLDIAEWVLAHPAATARLRD